MPGVGWLTRAWLRASFSLKFAVVILVTGSVMAAVPLLLAESTTRSDALNSAANKAGIASNLVEGQRTSLDLFIGGVARQIAATNDLADPAATRDTLAGDSGVNATGDVIGVIRPGGRVVAVQGAITLTSAQPLTGVLVAAVETGAATASAPDGHPWLVAAAPVPGSDAEAFVARPVTSGFVSAIDLNIATGADPVDVVVLDRNGTYALAGTIDGVPVAAGATPDPALRSALSSPEPGVVSLNRRQSAVAATPIGAGFTMVVITPDAGLAAGWELVLLLLALILVAMLTIVAVVRTSLQRPLRLLDRAVAALGRGDFSVAVPSGSDDEVGRLSESFEAMRRQFRSTMRASAARASVAIELSAAQPLETALAVVCAGLRRSMEVDTAIILVNGSEMADPYAVVDGVRDIPIDGLLEGDGPLGEGYRYTGPGALILDAAPASDEAHLGVREFCVAPLRMGARVHGVLGVANASGGFTAVDADLVASTADQVALALERERFLAVMQRQASVDDLTGLHNHRFLVDYLGQQVALAERLGAPLSVLMLDIDHFKVLNDTHGHQAGDTALAAFAKTLLNSVRRADLAARYGGEEFAVVMADTTAAEARLVAEKIRAAVSEISIPLAAGTPPRLTVSIGGACFPEDTDNAGELLSLADAALYQAKDSGRNTTRMATHTGLRAPVRPAATMREDASIMEREVVVSAGRRRRSSQ